MSAFDVLPLSGGWEAAQYPAGMADRAAPDTAGLQFFGAAVPGAIQYDLVAAGKLENPYSGSAAARAAAWVAKSDWIYRKRFCLEGAAIAGRRWFLRANGVDTFGEAWLNGALLGETRNNYRSYEFPIEPGALLPGENLLEIRVKAHHRMVADRLPGAARLGHDSDAIEGLMGKSLIRRYQRSFFSGSSLLNLGAGVLGIGINRPVELACFGRARIADWAFRTLSLENGKARCELSVEADVAMADIAGADGVRASGVEAGGGECELRGALADPETGKEVAVFGGTVRGGALAIPIEIEAPKLWWPAGYGRPFLYRLRLSLEVGGACVHSLEKYVGIKTAELVTKQPNGRESFHFSVNGKRIWARGQNTIPLDYIKGYGAPEEERRAFRMLENMGANLVRVWGGGMPAGEAFYDACDRLGIMLWAEGFLHSNVYPDYDASFVEEYAGECREMLKGARRHASLCMVCGGNEQIEGWEEFGWQGRIDRFYGEKLFTECLPPIAAELCPEIPYIPNSPHGGADCQSPASGDAHSWGNYFNAFKDPLFVSETCWSQESYSRPETLEKCMGLRADDYQGQGWLARWTERTSRPRIGRLAYSSWPHGDNPSLRRYLRTLELEQARADYSAIRLFRLRSPSNGGVIYWSFNKGGPLFQFGCVEYGGYPMMSYYVLERLYRGVAAGLFRDGEEIYAAVSNQSGGAFRGTAEIAHLRADGRRLGRIGAELSLEDGECRKALASGELYGAVADRTGEAFYLRLRDESGAVAGEDILFLCPFFEFAQSEAPVAASARKLEDGAWEISLEAFCVVRQLDIESNHKHLCSENYFPMAPGEVKRVRVELLERTGGEAPRIELQTLGIPGLTTIELE
jgi:beta-mannosidase